MKNFKNYFMYLAVLAMAFTSCSKDESTGMPDGDSEKAQLSFGTSLNDLLNNRAQTKAHFSDIPECSDAEPSSVMVVISQGGENMDPITLDVLSDDLDDDGDMDYFTDYSNDLELVPGTYYLEEFMVYDADDNMIWIAPRDEDGTGEFDGYVENALPLMIELNAGVKKYVDVEVLCYDDRMPNVYGYLFFDFEGKELIEFCLFGNFCPPNGRHYVASYSVDVWNYVDGETTEQLYDGLTAKVNMDNGEYSADPLCVVLPDGEGDDEYYFEITILETDEYSTEERIIRSGVITDVEVRSFFDGDDNLDYLHFFEGCGQTDTPPIFTDPTDEADNYKACLKPLNDSGVIAFSYSKLQGNKLFTTVLAYNTVPEEDHPQHIHGFTDGTVATCPDISQDANEDGLIQIGEGLSEYGDVQLSLQELGGTFPTASGSGMYYYERTFTLSNAMLGDVDPLEEKVVVLHGLNVDGVYEATLPVACGPYVKVE
jgi:hypothetical protein